MANRNNLTEKWQSVPVNISLEGVVYSEEGGKKNLREEELYKNKKGNI